MEKIDYTKDLEGKQFGRLKVLHMDTERTRQGKRKWVCECLACGKIVSIPRTQLINGDAKSCGCKQYEPKEKNKINLIGKKIGYLKVLEKVSGNGVSTIWKCQYKAYGKYYSYIGFKGKLYGLGFYAKKEEAEEVRKKAEKELYGTFLNWYAENFPEQWKRMQKKE